MNPETILQIIKLSLELAIRIHDDMPTAQRQQVWENHFKTMQFWQGLFERVSPQEKASG